MPNRAGEKTRAAILDKATRLATVEGLEGLSLAHLAGATKMSKSGLYAHFGSKEELQLATIDAAREVFLREVVEPGLTPPTPLAKLRALCDAFLSHVEREVFPGGCFFSAAAAEVGTRRGRVRDSIAAQQREWLDLLERLAAKAQSSGELATAEDPAQLAFELNATLVAANTAFLLHGDSTAFDRSRQAIAQRLDPPRTA